MVTIFTLSILDVLLRKIRNTYRIMYSMPRQKNVYVMFEISENMKRILSVTLLLPAVKLDVASSKLIQCLLVDKTF